MTDYSPHPLFPATDEDEDPPQVTWFWVKRDGKTYPRRFAPEEITDLEQIASMWGGGHYTLIGRNDRHITGTRDYTIPGPSRPFMPEDDAPVAAAEPAAAAAVPRAGGDGGAMAILQFVSAQQAQTMQMFLQMSQHQSQMMLAMMQNTSETQLAHQREMAQMHERASARDAQMFAAILGNRGNADPQALFLQGVTAARELLGVGGDDGGGGGGDDEGLGELVQGAASLFQGVQTFAGAQPPQQQQQPAPQAPNPELPQ